MLLIEYGAWWAPMQLDHADAGGAKRVHTPMKDWLRPSRAQFHHACKCLHGVPRKVLVDSRMEIYTLWFIAPAVALASFSRN